MIETTNPDINVGNLMERVRTEAAKIALERNDAAVGNGKPLATALARMRTMTPPPAFPSINAVDVKRERLDQLLQNARKKTAVARWIPKIFRGLFRRQGDYNKLLLETTSILVRATAQLSSRLSEVTAGLELQNEWMRELPAQQVDPRHLQDLQAQADRLGVHLVNLESAAKPVLDQFAAVKVQGERLREQGNWMGREINNLQLRFETDIKERQVAMDKNIADAIARSMEAVDTSFIKGTLLQQGAMLQSVLDNAKDHTAATQAALERHTEFIRKVDAERIHLQESYETAMKALAAEVAQIVEHFEARPYMADPGLLAQIVEHFEARPYMADPGLLETADDAGRKTIGFRANAAAAWESDAYLSFENIFRGPESLIRERQKTYLKDLREHEPIVDLGCGRGEMLDLLREAGIAAVGVDSDAGMVRRARAKGHSVEEADVLEYLRTQPDHSLGAIFSAQLIEHLSLDKLLQLLELAAQKLKPGGVMIAETVNPHSHRALKSFWVDLTHQKPIFPEVLVAFFRQFGYVEALMRFPAGTGDFERDRLSEGEYAVIARTSAS